MLVIFLVTVTTQAEVIQGRFWLVGVVVLESVTVLGDCGDCLFAGCTRSSYALQEPLPETHLPEECHKLGTKCPKQKSLEDIPGASHTAIL